MCIYILKRGLKVVNCKNVYVSGISFKDNPRVHMIFDDVEALVVDNVTVEAPHDSPNSDGIHLGGSTDVTLHNSLIGTGMLLLAQTLFACFLYILFKF